MATEAIQSEYQILFNDALRSVNTFINTLDSKLASVGSSTKSNISSKIESGFDGLGGRLGRIFDTAFGTVLGGAIQNGIGQINNFVGGATTQFDSYNKAITTLEIIAPRFNLDANQAKLTAESLAKELKIGVGTSAESLQNLFKSGLNIDQSSDLLRRFNNEAITGKSANISLDDAIQNLSFAYNTQNSAIGNLSGISENFSDIQQRGLKILQSRGELIGKSIGQLDEAQRKEAQYAGIIQLTNLTQGSSEKFIGTRVDNQIRLNKVITDGQIALGKKLDPVFNQALIALTPIIESLTSKISQLDFSQISDAIKSFNVQPIIDSINNFDLAKFIQDIVTLKDTIVQLSPVILGVITSLAGLSILNTIVGIITSIGAVLTFLISPIGLITIGIAGLVAGIIYLYQNFETIQSLLTQLQPVFDTLSNSFKQMFDYLGGGNIILGFFNSIWTTLVGAFNFALPLVIGIIAQLGFFAIQVGVLAGYMITQLYPVFLQVVQAVGNLIVALQPLINTFVAIAGVLVNVLLAGFNLVFPIIGAIVTQYIGAIGTIFAGLINTISGVIKVISAIFTGDFGRAFQGLQQIFQGGVQVITGIFQGIIAPFRGVFDGVLNLFKSFDLFSIGVNLVQGLINGIAGSIGGIYNTLAGGITNAIDGAKKLLGINSPSRVFMEIGGYTGEGLLLGLQKYTPQLSKAFDNLVNIPQLPQLPNPKPDLSTVSNRNVSNVNTNNQSSQNNSNNNYTNYGNNYQMSAVNKYSF